MSVPQYVECPYCPHRYKDSVDPIEHKRFTDAIAGHINLKHKNAPPVKVAQDFQVEIPGKDPNVQAEALAKRKAALQAQLDALNKGE